MSQPTPYARLYNLTQYAALNTAAPYNAAQHDAEFNAIEDTLGGVLANLALIQRDDGELRNAIVTPDALSEATLNLIGDWAPKGPWLPDQQYAVRDMVTVGLSTSYVCATAHTSTTFATDLALGYWQRVNGAATDATTVTFTTNDVILGRVSAGSGDGEEIACTSFARTLLDDADAATARATLGLGSANNPTFNAVSAASLTLSGLTANAFLYSGTAGLLTSTTAPTNGQLLIGSTGAAPVVAALSGTTNQVAVTNGAGTITLSLPQNIHAAATPSFATVNLTNLSTGAVVFVGASSALSQDATNLVWDDTNNRLGVGTSTPLAGLHVSRSGAAGEIYLGQAGNGLVSFSVGVTDVLSISAVNGGDIAALSETAATFFANTIILGDVTMEVPAANVLEQRNSTNAQTWRLYNTYTAATNYERAFARWASNVFEVGTEAGAGGGTNRGMALLSATSIIGLGGMTSSFPALKRSSAALQVRLADDSAYAPFAAELVTVAAGTATPAGGSTAARLLFGTTAGFGIYYGSGVPTVSAAQGSLYLRSDGSSTTTRAYINTDGATTWTSITTAA